MGARRGRLLRGAALLFSLAVIVLVLATREGARERGRPEGRRQGGQPRQEQAQASRRLPDLLTEGLEDLLLGPAAVLGEDAGLARGRVVHVDRFGNCITNIEAAQLEALGPPEGEGPTTKHCAFCGSEIHVAALRCPHCAGFLPIAGCSDSPTPTPILAASRCRKFMASPDRAVIALQTTRDTETMLTRL